MVVTPPPPYEDILRTVGYLLDRDEWRDIALTEEPHCLVVRGTRQEGSGRADAALRLAPEDLARLRGEARRRRGWSQPAGDAGYQGRLRAVGWLAEEAGLRELRVAEAGADLLLRGRVAGASGGRRAIDKRLTPAEIDRLLARLHGLRGTHTRELPPLW
jgi:hypothetical protein